MCWSTTHFEIIKRQFRSIDWLLSVQIMLDNWINCRSMWNQICWCQIDLPIRLSPHLYAQFFQNEIKLYTQVVCSNQNKRKKQSVESVTLTVLIISTVESIWTTFGRQTIVYRCLWKRKYRLLRFDKPCNLMKWNQVRIYIA